MAIFTAIGTALGASTASAAAVGAAVTAGVGALGQAYSGIQAQKAQQKAARVANAIERRKQLAAIRKAQRMNEAMGVGTGTTGSSSQIGQSAAIASSGAQTIGQQAQEIAAAGKISHWNNMATGFGVIGGIGQIGMAMPAKQTKPDTFNS